VAFLWFTLAAPQFIGDAVWPWIYSEKYSEKRKAAYVTIEGIPGKAMVLSSNIPRMEFIAVSKFVARCLRQIGLRVIDVCHHAVDMERHQTAVRQCRVEREKLAAKYGDVCKLIYVGRHDPRKGLDKLRLAVELLSAKRGDDFVVLLVTDTSAEALFRGSRAELLAPFGSMRYEELLRMMAACDYLVFPSMCEGFGLPVLEANALGLPAIHCWFPPLDEFSSKDFNFVWDYDEERFVKCDGTQYWVFHDYPAEYLAEMMDYAIDVFYNSKDEYRDYCVKAMKHAKKWDYKRVYKKLLKHLGL